MDFCNPIETDLPSRRDVSLGYTLTIQTITAAPAAVVRLQLAGWLPRFDGVRTAPLARLLKRAVYALRDGPTAACPKAIAR
jgi:hypothetical protein